MFGTGSSGICRCCMKKGDEVFLRHNLECTEKIERYLQGFDRERFLADEKTVDAVNRNVEVIGEAAKNVSEELRDENPRIEWRKIIATRNRLIHGYAGVDPEIIWTISRDDLRHLKSLIEKILEEPD